MLDVNDFTIWPDKYNGGIMVICPSCNDGRYAFKPDEIGDDGHWTANPQEIVEAILEHMTEAHSDVEAEDSSVLTKVLFIDRNERVLFAQPICNADGEPGLRVCPGDSVDFNLNLTFT